MDEKAGRSFFARHDQIILSLSMFAIWSFGYFAISHLTEAHEVKLIPLRLDGRIPFIPEFVFIYLGLYPMFLLPFFLIRDSSFFRVVASAYITTMVICYIIFFVYPVTIERPVFPSTSFSTWVLNIIYRADRPVNCFPSMHVAMSLIASLTIWEVHRIRGIITILATLGIAISTLFVKQHYVLDVFFGTGIALLIYYIYFKEKVVEILSANVQRIEETIEGAINRRIDERIISVLDETLERKIEMVLDRQSKSPEI